VSLNYPESESDVRRGLLETLREAKHHACAVETSTQGAGFPDVNTANGVGEWNIECKFIKTAPQKFWLKNAPLVLSDRQMRPAQRVWHTKRWHAGNTRSYYLVVFKVHTCLWILLPGGPAAEHFGRTWTIADIKHHALLRSPERFTPTELTSCLR
jgi:hypothetical protein